MPQVPTYDTFRAQVQPAAPQLGGPAPGQIMAEQLGRLGRGISAAGDAATRITLDALQEANRTRVDDAMNELVAARTKLQAQAVMLQGRNALDRPGGQALPDEFGAQLDTVARSVGEGLGNDRQRLMFREQAQHVGQQLRGALTSHMVEQQKVYQRETMDSTVKVAADQGALLWRDPGARAQAADVITRTVGQMASTNGWDKATTEAQLVASLSPMHVGVMHAMIADGQGDAAKKYLSENSASLTLQARAQMLEATKIDGARAAAQQFADDAIARGMSPTDALAEARKRFSGREEDEAVREVHARFQEQEIAKARATKEVVVNAWSAVMEKGKVPPTLLADLRARAPEEERQIRDWLEAKWRRAKADAEGKVKTDMDVYYGLRRMAMDDPAQFSQLDLRKSQPYLKDGDLKHLIEIQGAITKGDNKAMESQRVLKQTLGMIKAEVAAIGIDLTPKDDGKPDSVRKAQETAKFLGALTQALDEATANKKAPLTPEEARRIGMSMVREGIEQGSGIFGFFQTTKRGYEIAADPDIPPGANFVAKRFGDIPRVHRDALEHEWRARNKRGPRQALTNDDEAAIERAYQRGIDTGRFR